MTIFSKELQNFINANLNSDLHSLLLKKSPFAEVPMPEIVKQIRGRQVATKKFPFLLKEGVIFPPNLNLEQTSSQATAQYKAQNLQGKSFIDLTAGFGIDAFFMSENFEEVTLVDSDSMLLQMVQHNWDIFGRKAQFINQNMEDFLKTNTQNFDVAYLDPSRRDQNKKKVFLLEDLSPNLLEVQEDLRKLSRQLIIKLSPLIDVSYLVSVLKNITQIEIIAVKNEVKEVVVYISSESVNHKILCRCINLETGEPVFEFYYGEEEQSSVTFSEPERFIYIPNNAVLKSGAFNTVSDRFQLKKFHPNSHLYTSADIIEDFPGRILEAEPIDPKTLKKGDRFNIISKNHPLKPEEIKKKYKLNDGGNRYLIFTQTGKGKIVLSSK